MTIGRTHDLKVHVASASAVHEISNILGVTVTGAVDQTSQSHLGREVEDATAHAVGVSYDFSSLFDNAEFDAAVSSLLGARYVSQPSDQGYVIVSQGQWTGQAGPTSLDHWQGHPVSFTRPGFAAPNTDAITRPWSLSPDDRGGFGTKVVVGDTTSTANLLAASDERTNVYTTCWLLITSILGTISDLALTDGTTAIDVAHQVGLTTHDISDTNATLTLADTGTGSANFIAFLGRKELVADRS